MTELRPLRPRTPAWSAAAPRASTRATWPRRSPGPAGRWCTSRATTRGWRRCGRPCASSRRSCRCCASRPGTACPTTASRRTPRSPRRGWRRWRRWPRGFDRPAAVLTTVNAATQRVPAARRGGGCELHRGGRRAASTSAALRGYLARMGYQQAPTVTEPGEFAIRGGLIDLYPPGARGPVRLDLFGDVLESARRFDPETQRTSRDGQAGRARAGLRGDPRRGGDPALPHPLPGDVRRRRPATTRSTRRSAPGASSRATSTGCRSSTSGWRRSSTTCPARRCCSTTRPPPRGPRAGPRSPTSTTRGPRRSRRSRSSAPSTSRCRRASSISTTRPGTRRSAGRPLHQLSAAAAAARPRRDRRRRAHRPRLRPRAAAGGRSASSARWPRTSPRAAAPATWWSRATPPAPASGSRASSPTAASTDARDIARAADLARRPRPPPRGLAARARLRGAGPHGHLRAGRARRPADPRRPAGASARRTS